ncbi:MAG: uracil-DNA glycosylase family protein [Methylococcaceae bacterium]
MKAKHNNAINSDSEKRRAFVAPAFHCRLWRTLALKIIMPLSDFINRVRSEHPDKDVPAFDPNNGNEAAKLLFLFEAPGAKAVRTGYISFENPDPTANNFHKQLEEAAIGRHEIALWNIVPWYIGNSEATSIRAAIGSDIEAGLEYLPLLLQPLPGLRYIILVGGAARRTHVYLSRTTDARIVSCHHTSAKVMNTTPEAWVENVKVFQFIKSRMG